MTYDKEFEDLVYTMRVDPSMTIKDRLWFVWKAARENHYRIGEEVESASYGNPFEKARIGVVYKNDVDYCPREVRRIPAWKPKEGEAVFLFTGHENRVHVGVFAGFEVDGRYKVITQSGECARTNARCIKPFSTDKISKPWEEI